MKADPASSLDKTNFLQSLMHMIKGNFGTGILAMPASFNHCGLINALVGLPILCMIATYCVHLLVRSSQHLENKMKSCSCTFEYTELAKGSFTTGPKWMRPLSGAMCKLVDGTQIMCQLGICCVYLVFIVDNLTLILATFGIHIGKMYMFLLIMPIALLLSYIKTLKRLAIASACANFLQVVGISIIIEYLLRDMPANPKVEYFRPLPDVALGFGSAMFAFEGIAVVMPIYGRMKRQQQMGGLCGVINMSYVILLCLYVIVGLFGYLRFGSRAAGSITLNLPKEPLYEVVRGMFATSLFLSYPLQFYVLNEIIWNWISDTFLTPKRQLYQIKQSTNASMATSSNSSDLNYNASPSINGNNQGKKQQIVLDEDFQKKYVAYEYCCRTGLVLFTFVLAMCVPRLNLMMDFFGSISGTALSITLPPLIHLAAFWEDTSGISRLVMAVLDGTIILFGLIASANGSYFSFIEIVNSFGIPVTATGGGHH